MTDTTVHRGSTWEVFKAFLVLGLTSFGGPVAHLAYFRTEFVERRRWLTEKAYAELVAMCQFLPGPASSQVGFALGLKRGGATGALAAWVAFTLPSAAFLVMVAKGASLLEGPTGSAVVQGLKVVAVAIVAHAVWGMASRLCPDWQRAGIALGAVLIITLVGGAMAQLVAIAFGALAGLRCCQTDAAQSSDRLDIAVAPFVAFLALVLFLSLFVALPVLHQAFDNPTIAVVDAFYRAGALVFGGGHVVLPLLEAEVVQRGWLSADAFLTGYGAAQAIPGPLFTFSAYLGTLLEPGPNGVIGAGIALLAIFLPGFLLLVAVIPFWNTFGRNRWARALKDGANAAVVGILGAALYQPVWTSAIFNALDFSLALAGFVMLTAWRLQTWIVVLVVGSGGALSSLI